MTRIIIAGLFIFTLVSCKSSQKGSSDPEAYIYSVHGKMGIENLGVSLTHEHVMSRFGLEPAYIAEYDKDSLLMQVVPYLKEVKALGVKTIFDCTTAYFGRNVSLLREISDSSGVEIITNTGYYAGANDRYVPESAYESSSEDIAQIWIDEFENGIDETGIRPGFIKLAFDKGTSEIDLKLFTAGILTHLSTGLTMVVHTENNVLAASKQLELLDKHEVSPSAWVWVHASKMDDVDFLVETAKRGGWISLDKFKADETEEYVSRLALFREKDLLKKVLLSHDGNSYNREGNLKGYQAVITHLVPALKDNAFSEEEIHQILVINPQNAFKVGVRHTAAQ
jgi:phosphotriesterase-related protein